MTPGPAKFDWWTLFHRAMTELQWPAWYVGMHTIPQLAALLERPPDDRGRIDGQGGLLSLAERLRREEAAWTGKGE